jgi:hypothetical protein
MSLLFTGIGQISSTIFLKSVTVTVPGLVFGWQSEVRLSREVFDASDSVLRPHRALWNL